MDVLGRVALASCAAFPDGDEDAAALIAALAARGAEADTPAWDDASVDWGAYDLVVVRSTWDYVPRRDEFLSWAGSVPRVLNAPEVLRWNTDKRYLRDLAALGLPAVETTFVEPGGTFEAPAQPYVVKPAVGAGSREVARYRDRDDGAREHVARLHAQGETAMVQRYLEAVENRGETALLFTGGAYSHAVRKGPMLTDTATPDPSGLYIEENITPSDATAEEREVADRTLAAIPFSDLLYARIDLIDGPDGPRLLELELAEPSLFLGYSAGAVEQFADAIVAQAR